MADRRYRLRQWRAGLRGGDAGCRGRRHRHLAGDAGAGADPGARPQGRDPDPAGGAAEFRLSARFLRSRGQRIHAASSAGLLEGGGAVADPWRAEAGGLLLPARHRLFQHARWTRSRHRGVGRFQHQEPRLFARQRRHPYARRIFDLRLGDRAHADGCRFHAGLGRLPRPAARHLSAAQTETRRAELTTSMKPADVGLAVMVAVIWGLAFVASRIALDEFSPELMTALRFAIAAVPCLFVRRPNVPWPVLISISFTLFLGQFHAQAFGIAHGVPVGLSSVILQSQALFTIGFAAIAFRELPSRTQAIGIGIAAIGLLMICGTV